MSSLSDVSLDYGQQAADTVTDVDSAVQKLIVVLSVPLGTRKRYEDFGCNTYTQLFEPFDDVTAGWIGVGIQEAIENPANEIRDLFTDVGVQVTRGPQTYMCRIDFRVLLPSGATSDRISYKFQLKPQGQSLSLPRRVPGLRSNANG